MVQRYQSKYTRESLYKSDGEHISTAKLEEQVLNAGSLSHDALVHKIEEQLKVYQKQVAEATFSSYSNAIRTTLHLLDKAGVPVVTWVQERQLRYVQRGKTELEKIVGQYEKQTVAIQKGISQMRTLRNSAGILMERYDETLTMHEVKQEELQKEYEAARSDAIGNVRNTAHLAIQMEIENIWADRNTVRRKRDMVAAKVNEYHARIKASERGLTHILSMQQNHQNALIKASSAEAYATIVQDERKLNTEGTFKTLYEKEKNIAAVVNASLRSGAAFLEMMKATHEYEGIELPEAEQDETEQELRRSVEEKNDYWVDRARRVLEQDKIVH